MKNPKNKVQNRSTKHDPVIQELPIACANETAAVSFFEKQRWGVNNQDACCTDCGSTDVYMMRDLEGGRQKNYRWKCRDCKYQFTVRIGTIFEESGYPLSIELSPFGALQAARKGFQSFDSPPDRN